MKKFTLTLFGLFFLIVLLGATPPEEKKEEEREVEFHFAKAKYDYKTKTYVFTKGELIDAKEKAKIEADEIFYNEETEKATAKGNLKFTDEENEITAPSLEADLKEKIVVLNGEVMVVNIRKKKEEDKKEVKRMKSERELEGIEPKEKPFMEVEREEKPEKEKPDEVLLTETIKSVFLEPEIAIQIVEKLLDLITLRGLERNFIKSLSSKNLELDDLLCPICYREDGIKIFEAFNEVLNSKDIRKVLGQIEPIVEYLIKQYKNRSDYFAVLSELPKCNFCDKVARFDIRTVFGPWAYACYDRFVNYGVGLGLGYGQILVLPEEVEKYRIKKRI